MSGFLHSPSSHDNLLDAAAAEINKLCGLIAMARECGFTDLQKEIAATLRAAALVLDFVGPSERRERVAALCRQIDAALDARLQ
jgi:hypothetical protein